MKLVYWGFDRFSTLECFSWPLLIGALKDCFMAAVTLWRPNPMADLFLEEVLPGYYPLTFCWSCCSYTAWNIVRFEVWAAFSKAPIIDFLIANFLTESGGLVVNLNYAACEGFLAFGFDRLDWFALTELSLSLLLMTIVPNSNVSLFGVSISMSKRGHPLLLMLDLSWEVG